MDDTELQALIAELRSIGDDHQHVEVKKARGGLPADPLARSLSAFSNTSGGIVVLGLSPNSFEAVGVWDAAAAARDFRNLCHDALAPAISPAIEIHQFEGVQLLVATIDEADSERKPIVVRKSGEAHRRVADADEKLSPYQIQILRERSAAPVYDCAELDSSSIKDLDANAVSEYVAAMRQKTRLDGESDQALLERMRVLGANGRPTVAGLLTFGQSPQTFLPQVAATFVAYPTSDGSALGGVKFIDSRRLEGTLGEILDQAESVLLGQMARRAQADAMAVQDHWEYPPLALREAIANALVHRDLSPIACARPVQIALYPDRLEVISPGGLHGSVTEENIVDGVTSARNGCLMRLLEDVDTPSGNRIIEGRGSGIPEILSAVRAQGGTAHFVDDLTSFKVIFPASSFLSPDNQQWIASLNQDGLSDSQIKALAMMKSGVRLDNPTYRQATGSDSQDARTELQDLVGRGLVLQIGERRWTRYILSSEAQPPSDRLRKTRAERKQEILELVEKHGPIARSDLTEHFGLSDQYMRELLKDLVSSNHLEMTTKPQSNNAKYRTTGLQLTQPAELAVSDELKLFD